MNSELLSENEILKGLDGNVRLFFYDTVSSTNDEARALGEGGEDMSVIIAREQTKGRGTHGRSFFSEKDEGLFLSFLFKPLELTESDIRLVTPAAAIVTARAIRELTGAKVKIKWINDIVYRDKKLCGILCESGGIKNGRPEFIVVGIGINISVSRFPEEIRDTAASLKNISEKEFDVNTLCANIANGLYKCFTGFNGSEVVSEYKALSATLNRKISFTYEKERLEGCAADIDDSGNLIVSSNGRVYRLFSSEASIKLI